MLMLQYQTMMRSRSRASYETFWGHMKRLFDVSDGPLRDAFVWFLGAERDLGFPHLTASPAGALTITKSSLFTSVAHWRKKLGGPFKVVHDSSSALSKEKDIWQLILGPELPKAEIGYDRRKVIFPLNVEEVVFADSKSHATLQLADIVAGATATFFRSRLDDAYRRGYAQLLKEAGITEMIQGVVWPSTAVTPEEMGTEGGSTGSNLADFLATQMKRAGVRPS